MQAKTAEYEGQLGRPSLSTLVDEFRQTSLTTQDGKITDHTVSDMISNIIPHNVDALEEALIKREGQDAPTAPTMDDIDDFHNNVRFLIQTMNEVLEGDYASQDHRVVIDHIPEIASQYEALMCKGLAAVDKGELEIDTTFTPRDIKDQADALRNAYYETFGPYVSHHAGMSRH